MFDGHPIAGTTSEMKRLSDNFAIACMALLLSVAGTLAWLADRLLDWRSPAVAGLLFSTCGIAALAVWLVRRRNAKQMLTAWHYLDAVCRLEPPALISSRENAQLPLVAESHPWHELLERVRDRLVTFAEALERAEHARAAVEVRARRSIAQYERMERIFSSLGDPVLAIDPYGEIVLTNRSADELLGLRSEGESDESLSPENRVLHQLVRCEKLLELIDETRRRRTLSNRMEEVELVGADGQPRWYSVTAMPFIEQSDSQQRRPQEQAPGVVAVLRDISGQKAAQKRNAEFVSSVSHEMKTPLASIKAYVELLADGDAEDEATREEFLDVISTQANRLQRLIDNLLNLARIEAGVVKVHKEQHSLNDLLEEAFQVIHPAAEQKGIRLSCDLSPLYLGVHVDRDMLLQAAINLLSNAVKYTPEGGRVVLRSRQSDGEAMFEVEDSGVGLSPEDCERVFEKFYRVKKDSQMASGTGLGLPLVKHIIEEIHNGRLTVRSTPGEGSTFSVFLPLIAQQR